MNLHAVIMAGGSGTRFWPASRKAHPKQFLPLANGKPLLQDTVDRVAELTGKDRTWIITNALQAEGILKLMPDFPRDHILLEPEARDTAPCVALAAAQIEAQSPGAIIAMMPADHLIQPVADFQALLAKAANIAADRETLVTLGIQPSFPATGFGYIELGQQLDADAPQVHQVSRFLEKPDQSTAESFLAAGNFLWNSGIFIWTYQALHQAMAAAHPELAICTKQMLAAAQQQDQASLEKHFKQSPRTSVDYAVMEKARKVAVIRADIQWNDLGSFLAMNSVVPKDAQGNVALTTGPCRSFLQDSKDCVVYGDTGQTITLFGASDLVVVAVNDAIMVCPKDRAGDLKALIQGLRDAGHEELL